MIVSSEVKKTPLIFLWFLTCSDVCIAKRPDRKTSPNPNIKNLSENEGKVGMIRATGNPMDIIFVAESPIKPVI